MPTSPGASDPARPGGTSVCRLSLLVCAPWLLLDSSAVHLFRWTWRPLANIFTGPSPVQGEVYLPVTFLELGLFLNYFTEFADHFQPSPLTLSCVEDRKEMQAKGC